MTLDNGAQCRAAQRGATTKRPVPAATAISRTSMPRGPSPPRATPWLLGGDDTVDYELSKLFRETRTRETGGDTSGKFKFESQEMTLTLTVRAF